MITIALLGCVAVAALISGLLLGAKAGAMEVTYRRLAWLPVTALVIEFALAKPALSRLGYFAIVPPILTCLLSLFLAVVGATLAAARERNEPSSGLVRATLVAAIPGMLLFAYMIYGFVARWCGVGALSKGVEADGAQPARCEGRIASGFQHRSFAVAVSGRRVRRRS